MTQSSSSIDKKQAIGISLFAALLALFVTPIQREADNVVKVQVRTAIDAIKETRRVETADVLPYGDNDEGEEDKEDSEDWSGDDDDSGDTEDYSEKEWATTRHTIFEDYTVAGEDLARYKREPSSGPNLGQYARSGPGEPEPVEENHEPESLRWSNFPDGWESYSYYDIFHHFDCRHHSRDQTKPLYTLEDWVFFRKQYKEMVTGELSDEIWYDPVPPTEGYTLTDDGPPPYYAAYSRDGRGRGLFASRDIKKGELVHDDTKSAVMFLDAMAWRRFVFSLPRRMACDVALWSWTQEIENDDGGSRRLFICPNISSLINSDASLANVLPKSRESSNKMYLYATRDIRYGEEILTDYEYNSEGEVVLATFELYED